MVIVGESDILRCGTGCLLLVLYGEVLFDPGALMVDLLVVYAEVIVFMYLGFGHVARSDEIETVYDLVYYYFDLVERLLHERVILMGFSFGGWLAVEIVVVCSHHFDRLILVDVVGIKISDREMFDIFDQFNIYPAEVQRCWWHELVKWALDFDAMSDEVLVAHVRNREALCWYVWYPYMHNPRLVGWLRRIVVSMLVLWGGSDGIVVPVYGRAYVARILGARFEVIEGVGYYLEIEQSGAFVERVRAFLEMPCRFGI